MLDFWDDLEGYASYLFNKSHATSYSLLSCITAWLKCYYTEEYFAAHLTYLNDMDKLAMYSAVLEKDYGIKITAPDINESLITYAPYKKKIVYGIGKVKGVGDAALNTIINARPYTSIEDFITKVNEYDKEHNGKKCVNKTATINLIKAGAFDFYNDNRLEVINEAYDIRKDKKDERFDITTWNKNICIEFEKYTLSTTITYKEWFDSIKDGPISIPKCKILKVNTRPDKKGRMMGFVTIQVNTSTVEMLVFGKQWSKYEDLFDVRYGDEITITGRKDNNKILFTKGARM